MYGFKDPRMLMIFYTGIPIHFNNKLTNYFKNHSSLPGLTINILLLKLSYINLSQINLFVQLQNSNMKTNSNSNSVSTVIKRILVYIKTSTV